MKNFNIEVITDKPKKINNKLSYKGQITVGDLKESFVMPLDSWTIEEYKQQWKEGLERIKGHDSSCLVVTISGLKENYPFILLWILYRVGDIIFIQNHMLYDEIFQERAKGLPPFDAKTCYLYVTPRETLSENDEKISEWKVDIDDIPE